MNIKMKVEKNTPIRQTHKPLTKSSQKKINNPNYNQINKNKISIKMKIRERRMETLFSSS